MTCAPAGSLDNCLDITSFPLRRAGPWMWWDGRLGMGAAATPLARLSAGAQDKPVLYERSFEL